MSTFLELQTAILDVSKNHYIQTSSDVTLASRINDAVREIAGGIRLPNGQISSPLPELYLSDTVAASTSLPSTPLPTSYQRGLFLVVDEDGDKIQPPKGGDYYSFNLFLNSLTEKDMSESGEIYRACARGTNLYYQGIPAESEDLTVHFYRLPVDMSENTDTPDGIPTHLQMRLIKNYIGYQLASEMVDGTERMAKYHENEFYKAMVDLQDYIGIDAIPEYYSGGGYEDLGTCD
jgi:hypothetical protein